MTIKENVLYCFCLQKVTFKYSESSQLDATCSNEH